MVHKEVLTCLALVICTTCITWVSATTSTSSVSLQEIGEEIHHKFRVNNADILLAKVESTSNILSNYYGAAYINNIIMESEKLQLNLGNATDELPYSAVISLEVTKNRYHYPASAMKFQTVFKVCLEPEKKQQQTSDETTTPNTEENETSNNQMLLKAIPKRLRPMSHRYPCHTPHMAPPAGMKKFYGLISVRISSSEMENDNDGQLICKEFHNFERSCCYHCSPSGDFNLTDVVNAESNAFYFDTDVVFYELDKM